MLYTGSRRLRSRLLNPNLTLSAQDLVIAAHVLAPKRYFFHDPNLARLDDGTLIVAAPQWGQRGTNVGRSLPYEKGQPFVVDGRLLTFVQERTHRDFQIVTSDDLVVLSRTSRDAKDQHDADLCTIHRVRDFRSLAMDLRHGGLGD